MTTITYGQAIDAIDASFHNVTNGIDLNDSTVEAITLAVNNDLQIRDYLIGLPVSYDIKDCVNFLDYLARMAGDNNRYAFDTVNAMYQYELENMEACKRLIASAREVNPYYSLTKLVYRVLQAGWPANSFATMRSELAPKVAEHIAENIDYEIEVAQWEAHQQPNQRMAHQDLICTLQLQCT